MHLLNHGMESAHLLVGVFNGKKNNELPELHHQQLHSIGDTHLHWFKETEFLFNDVEVLWRLWKKPNDTIFTYPGSCCKCLCASYKSQGDFFPPVSKYL